MKFFLIFLAFITFSSSAFAETVVNVGPNCFSLLEAEAEQGIRIHSELMVIGLNCQHLTPPGQENLYSQYRKFTAKNATLFSTYEMLLIKYFKKEGGGDAERQLHSMRTQFANRISNDAARMRPDAFCHTYAPRIAKAAVMDQAALHKWASTFFPGFGPSRPLCSGN